MFRKINSLFLLLFSVLLLSQTVISRLDKKTVGLGEPNTFSIKIDHTQGKPVYSAQKNELLPFHFEIIKDSIFPKADSYERVVEFSIFQEGTFDIPALEFKINNKIYKTTPYQIHVVNSANKGDQIHDIMKNKEVPMELSDYWQLYRFWILAGIAVVGLIIVIFAFLKYGKKPKDSPIELSNKTLKALQLLKQKNYTENGNYRSFYVEIIDIMRDFLTLQYHIPANVLLTDDLIAYMKKNHSISSQNEAIIEDVFLRGDMVKFAKIFPDITTMNHDWEQCVQLVKNSIQDIEFENLRKDV
ncbi:MAG: hypothetical protein JSS94_00580 [Bacteroidetes bacterium]|nr:hypothetical protein [Bacteroidota bacterium]